MSTNNDNTKQPSACIVIPVHKPFGKLGPYEIISLNQCIKVLRNYTIIFAGPDSIDWSGYIEFMGKNDLYFSAKNFPDHFFASPGGYNKLLITLDFYTAFSEFDYMLVYQTDCFVFRDELADWCRRGYDYVGAPWIGANMFAWLLYPWEQKKLIFVHRLFKNRSMHRTGNGGFSLRKISSIISNLKRFHKAADKWQAFEDSFFCHYIGTFNPFFRIPSAKKALAFSFDTNPEKAFQLNHNKLPFGCHAWFRNEKPTYEHNLPFWEPFVKANAR